MVGIHEHLSNCSCQLKYRSFTNIVDFDEGGDDRNHVERKCGDEKCERDGEQHQRQPGAALLGRASLAKLVRPVEVLTLTAGDDDLSNDEYVQTENHGERSE